MNLLITHMADTIHAISGTDKTLEMKIYKFSSFTLTEYIQYR